MTPIEQIKAEIKKQADNYQDTYTDCMRDNLLSFIESLKKEPPQRLDEAAKEYTEENASSCDYKGMIIDKIFATIIIVCLNFLFACWLISHIADSSLLYYLIALYIAHIVAICFVWSKKQKNN